MAAQINVLHTLMRGVRLPREVIDTAQVRAHTHGGQMDDIDDVTEESSLPPQLDFFRNQQQSEHANKASAFTRKRRRTRSDGKPEETDQSPYTSDHNVYKDGVVDIDGNGQSSATRCNSGTRIHSLEERRSDIHTGDEDRLVDNLVHRLCGQEALARGLIAVGAGVLTRVQERAMGLVACGGDVKDRGNDESTRQPVDVIAVAPTGSGKTLCYAAPVCAHLMAVRKQYYAQKRVAMQLDSTEESSNALERARMQAKRKRPRSKTSTRQNQAHLDFAQEFSVQSNLSKVNDENRLHGMRAVESKKAPFCLVLAPTRELAFQVGGVFERLAAASRMKLAVTVIASKATLTGLGGANLDIVVATPQRCALALERRLVDLSAVQHVVMDEADRLLDDGFIGQVDAVLAECGSSRRLHSFSATMPPATEQILRGLCATPVKIVVDGGAYGGSAAVSNISRTIYQRFIFVGGKGEQGKVMAVRGMLKEGLQPPVLVFVQSKERAAELFRELIYDGVHVDAIHADRSGAARSSAIVRFRAGRLPILIATDILARGLDFRAVSTVVNYDMPSSAEAYVHRIGRTGRNGRCGRAVTLFTEEDAELLRAIANVARASGAEVPDWMLAQKRLRRDKALALEKKPPKRKHIGGSSFATLPRKHVRAKNPGFSKKSLDA